MKKWIFLILSMFITMYSYGQCAMCRATLENSVSRADSDLGANLNMGILYLFIMPYLAAGVIFFLYQRARKRQLE